MLYTCSIKLTLKRFVKSLTTRGKEVNSYFFFLKIKYSKATVKGCFFYCKFTESR
nr:MAG TPA: hypothetical protein [Caudoviricetes sp.]